MGLQKITGSYILRLMLSSWLLNTVGEQKPPKHTKTRQRPTWPGNMSRHMDSPATGFFWQYNQPKNFLASVLSSTLVSTEQYESFSTKPMFSTQQPPSMLSCKKWAQTHTALSIMAEPGQFASKPWGCTSFGKNWEVVCAMSSPKIKISRFAVQISMLMLFNCNVALHAKMTIRSKYKAPIRLLYISIYSYNVAHN